MRRGPTPSTSHNVEREDEELETLAEYKTNIYSRWCGLESGLGNTGKKS
jgi:hypothetical protein